MKTVGIICEYNPFHLGHAWQIAQVRERFGADTAVICAMSGNYVQRGDFAIVSKHVRAAAALRGGADLVLEIPLPWAISSAEGFARGGVEVLAKTGAADTLCFGSECADTERIMRTARLLGTDAFSAALQQTLRSGASFAAARQEAARRVSGADADILTGPNDILAVEYCKAILARGSGMEALALPRHGSAHDGQTAGGIASASEIRRLLLSGQNAGCYLTDGMAALLAEEAERGWAPVTMKAMERAILARLRMMTEEELRAYDEGGEGLYHRFYDAVRRADSVEELLEAAKTKRYAYTRLRRMMLAAFLGVAVSDRPEEVPYLRVLAMNEKGKTVLRRMRRSAQAPILTKPADVRELSAEAQRLFSMEARSTDLYTLAFPDLSEAAPGAEWVTGAVILQ